MDPLQNATMETRTPIRVWVQDRRVVAYDARTKRALSCRDGILEYYGSELGIEPANQRIRVYRSPATTANAAMALAGLPVTDGHVSLDAPPQAPVGSIKTSRMVDATVPKTQTSVAVENQIDLAPEALTLLADGKRELSLGYSALMLPCDGRDADLEQTEIQPHHLAIVEAGRCGALCSFVDSKPEPRETPMIETQEVPVAAESAPAPAAVDAPKSLLDGYTLGQIQEVLWALPDAIRALPAEAVPGLIDEIKKLLAAAAPATAIDAAPVADAAPAPATVPEAPAPVIVVDQAAIDAAVKANADELTAVIDRARRFVGPEYAFAGKDAKTIIRDVLRAQRPTVMFSDEELTVAFRLVEPAGPDYSNFGDAHKGRFDVLRGKRLGGEV